MHPKKAIKRLCYTVIFLVACSKNSSVASSYFTILTTGKWQLADYSVTLPGTATSVSVFSSLPTCLTDNFYIFNTDSTLTIDEGATKCDSSAQQTTTTGNWRLLAGNTQLQGVASVGGTNSNSTATILELNNNTLKLQDTVTYSGASVNAIATFNHGRLPMELSSLKTHSETLCALLAG